MIKSRYLLLIALVTAVFVACNDNNDNPVDDFDSEAQAIIDNDSLVKFLNTHYYNDVIDSIKPLVTGATALMSDSRLIIKDVTESELDFKLYYLKLEEGTPDPVKGFPTQMDSIFVTYKGEYIRDNETLISFDQRINPIWLTLNSVIRGWTHTFVDFKSGKNVSVVGQPIQYIDGGKGVVFIPSGLAYGNLGTTGIPANSNLMFYFNLYDLVENTDHDNDLIPSNFEDPDGDGDPRNDDTDADGIPNYLDADDDNDGTNTRDEDVNGDGDPRNDDTDGDGTPDYLDNDSE